MYHKWSRDNYEGNNDHNTITIIMLFRMECAGLVIISAQISSSCQIMEQLQSATSRIILLITILLRVATHLQLLFSASWVWLELLTHKCYRLYQEIYEYITITEVFQNKKNKWRMWCMWVLVLVGVHVGVYIHSHACMPNYMVSNKRSNSSIFCRIHLPVNKITVHSAYLSAFCISPLATNRISC